MSTPDTHRMREAWQAASSADVVRALREIDEYPETAAEIIRAEADARGLTADSEEALRPPSYEGARRLYEALRPMLQTIGAQLGNLHRVIRGRLASFAFAWGLIAFSLYYFVPLRLGAAIGYGFAHIVIFVFYLLGLAALCCPWRDYRGAWLVALTAGGTYTIGALLFIIRFNKVEMLGLPPTYFFTTTCYKLGLHTVLAGVLLSTAVYLRRRFWPYHEPGLCRVCEYDLRGLTTPRCPECGTTFDHRGGEGDSGSIVDC